MEEKKSTTSFQAVEFTPHVNSFSIPTTQNQSSFLLKHDFLKAVFYM